ncbi:MAG: aminotransferase [Candidatus Latescibacterota bacterium]|nr:aminotransferase [Candidatus Latescibacterota bacterium]
MSEPLSTDSLRQLDHQHTWHPLFQHRQLVAGTELLVIAEGNGCTLRDSEGNSYIDAGGGLWNVNVGYGRREIAEAAFSQLLQLPYYPLSQINGPAVELAHRLAELLPGGLTRTFFSNSGSEANETAFKIARQYGRQRHPGENRHKIIARYQGYHGFTLGALSATGQLGRRIPYEPLAPGFLHVDPPYCYRCPLKLEYPACGLACADEFEQVIQREGPETVAAIVVEPVIGGGGVIVPPDDYLPRVREICERYGVLLIADEVITGWGRTGKLMACEHWEVVPDIMVQAKGITSGYLPLGATTVTEEVFDAFDGEPGEGKEFAQVCTYGGHPACCAAALANIDILVRERLWENAAAVGGYLLEQLQKLQAPTLGDVRGLGLMIGLELIEPNGEGRLNTPATAAIKGRLRGEGVIVGQMSHAVIGPDSVLTLSPPLTLCQSEADRIVSAFEVALSVG